VQLEKELAGHTRNIGSLVAFLFTRSELIHFDTEKLPKEAER
jgi:hypothetical protein